MTDLALPNRSHIFSPALILLQLALYRLDLRTMVFPNDIVLLGRPPSTSPESPPSRSSLGTEPSLGAPVRAEVDADPICNFPSCGNRLGRRTISATILTSSCRATRRLTASMMSGVFGKHTCGTVSPGLVHLSVTTLWCPLPVTPRPRCSLQVPRLHPYPLTIAGNGDGPHPRPPDVSITNEGLSSPRL
jgi:hypothetical protein